MCKKILLDERSRRLYPHQCFLLAVSLVFMLGNACSERGFSLQNYLKGPLSTRMTTATLSHRIRDAAQAPRVSSDKADAFVADVTDAYWASFKAVPARATSAAASSDLRRKRGQEAAAEKRAKKLARIDGSSNRALGGDCDAMPCRVEFSHDTYRVKASQPVEINSSLVGGLMAKLMVDTEGGISTERWEVGRVKKAVEVKVPLPEGGTTVSAFLFHWQALCSRVLLTDLQLDLSSCGPVREWVMVEPKPITPRSNAGRPKGKGRVKPRR